MKISAQDLRELLGETNEPASTIDNKMIGRYVLVRCRDAGVIVAGPCTFTPTAGKHKGQSVTDRYVVELDEPVSGDDIYLGCRRSEIRKLPGADNVLDIFAKQGVNV